MKNIVFMMDIKLNDEQGRYTQSRSLPYSFSVKSWQKWCEQNNAELLVLDSLLLPKEDMGICWQRYFLFDILESNKIDFNQVLMVDSDTIIHPECPDFFQLTNRQYSGIHNEGSYDWIFRSIENYSKFIFNDRQIDWWKYINGGFQIVNSQHKNFFKSVTEFYFANKESLTQIQNTYHVGTDQTPLNYLLQIHDIKTTLLPYEFNMTDMARKEILDQDLTMTKLGWIYHFNAIPNNTDNQATYYWMKKTYDHLYGN